MKYFLMYPLLAALTVSTTFADLMLPPPPVLPVRSYVLMDANSGQILAAKNEKQQMAPASLTKIMSMYVLADALSNKQINLKESVLISKYSSQMEGSRMFLKPEEHVSVEKLIKGMMVVSGNDASVALAEHLAGTEDYFVTIMNHNAQQLGMIDTTYKTATGLPQPNQLTTAYDQAKLTYNLMRNHPEMGRFYNDRSFSHNNIKQNNRNTLIFRDNHIKIECRRN